MKIGTFGDIKTRQCQYCLEKFENISGSKFVNHVK